MAVAIAIPPPLVHNEEIPTPEPAILQTLRKQQQQQQPKIKITDLNQGHTLVRTFDLRVGDIVQFNEHERLAPETGGIGLILMRYKVTRTPGHANEG
jgi:hypothetical protein